MNAEQAIARSVSHTQIVTLEYDAEVHAALSRESDDSVEANEVTEFWGTTEDGSEWRVHMRRAKFDRDAVYNEQIRALWTEAKAHGDDAQARLCELALDGDSEAAEKCIDAIEEAWHRAR